MKKALRLNAFCCMLFVLTGKFTNAGAQISITAGDLLGLIGKMETVEFDTSSSVMVDVGTTGGSQTWDFGGIPLNNPFEQTFDFLSPGDTPFADSFPDANFVQHVFVMDSIPGVGTFSLENWSYLIVRSDSAITRGNVSITTSSNPLVPADTTISAAVDERIPLPLSFNANWTESEVDTTVLGLFVTVSTTSSNNTIDAFGTVQIGGQNFECLRICSYDTTLSQQFINNIAVGPPTVTTNINYDWISKTSFNVATVTSQEGESNPGFTDASSFLRLKGGDVTSVSDEPGENLLPTSLNLFQNYPNPFNPETRIKYSIKKPGHVEIAIFDVNGGLVKNLVQNEMPAGEHSAVWDGTDFAGKRAASGRYIYRMTFNGEVKSKMMILLK